MFDKIRNNKFLNFLGNFLYTILVILVVLILLVVALQRFSNNTITLGGFRIFNILTGSMEPEYKVGDILVTKEIEPKEIKVGDDITYLGKEGDFAGKIVTHRVKVVIPGENGEYRFITQGLTNSIADPEITSSQIQGKVIYKTVILSFISKLVNNLYSMYFVIVVPMAIIIFVNVRRIYLDIVNKDEEDDDENENNEEIEGKKENKKEAKKEKKNKIQR